jgi:hypothetical protein
MEIGDKVGLIFGKQISLGMYEGRIATPKEVSEHCRIANMTEGESPLNEGDERRGIVIGYRDGTVPVVAAHNNMV